MKRAQTFDLLKPIVENMERVFIASDIIDEGSNVYKLYSCNTLWLTYKSKVIINLIDYVVIDILTNEWIKITGAVIPDQNFAIDLPFFTHGTILAKNAEMNAEPDSANKTPMIYLHEVTRERFNEDALLSLDRESDCDLYFMCDCDFSNWLTTSHDNGAIKPMRNMLYSFIRALKTYFTIGLITEFDVFDHANWGVYTTDKGHTKQIFSDELSGCQLRISIPFLKSNNCDDCSNSPVQDLVIPPFTPNPYMRKDVYDVDDNGIVDLAEEALNVENESVKFPAGENISSGRAVYLDAGLLYLYDPSNLSLYDRYLGITQTAGVAFEEIVVITEGVFEQIGLGLTPDEVYCIGPGGVLQVASPIAPAILQPVGFAITADKLQLSDYQATEII